MPSGPAYLDTILTSDQEELLRQERRWLGDLRATLVRAEANPDDQNALAESIGQLDELFLLVVAGEFNSGKSTFLNALLGQKILTEGVTITTTHVHILRYGQELTRHLGEDGIWQITAPIDLLHRIRLVDTPGTNAVLREHEALTSDFIPRSDLVLFVTSADRPFSESERQFLEMIRDWGKKIVFIINKIDILENEDQIAQVRQFVADNALTLLGVSPEVFPISARLAQKAKFGSDADGSDAWAASRFEPLERYLHDALDDTERVRLKLLNPLGVGRHLTKQYLAAVNERLNLLAGDWQAVEDLERQMTEYRADLERDFHFRLSEVDNILHRMESRGQEFFDETLRIGRVLDLIRPERIRQAFERQVIDNAPEEINQSIEGIIDWLVQRELHQWQAVSNHLEQRQRAYEGRIVGSTLGTRFEYDRERLIATVGQSAQDAISGFNPAEEAEHLANLAQQAVAESAIVEVGAVGLGAVLIAAFHTVLLDLTGILAAGLVASVGFLVLPARRSKAKEELREKIGILRGALTQNLQSQFEREVNRIISRMNDAVAPYTRFIRAERGKLEDMKSEISGVDSHLASLQGQIQDM